MSSFLSNLFIAPSHLLIAIGLVGCMGKGSLQEQAEVNAKDYLLEKRKDILILDSAQFGPVDMMAPSDTGHTVRYRLPYATQMLGKKLKREPKLVEFLLDSNLRVVRIEVLKTRISNSSQ